MKKDSKNRHNGIYFNILILMISVVLLLSVITLAGGNYRKNGIVSDKKVVVTSFYPVYVATLNVAKNTSGIVVENLTPNASGCLHDFQLSPDDVIKLENSDALIINGAGAESFLSNVTSSVSGLVISDSSVGTKVFQSTENHEDHTDHDHEEHEHENAQNEHIWTSPNNYIKQVENIADFLSEIDSENAESYHKNAAEYVAEIVHIRDELQRVADILPKNAVVFHSSLEYLAADLGLNIIASVPIGEDDNVSAAMLSVIEEKMKNFDEVLFLYDSQYPILYQSLVAENTTVAVIDTGVLSVQISDENAWIYAMEQNIVKLKECVNR